VFLLAPTTLAVLGVIAAITMVGAALAALAQDDIKRVLAYSTVSQLAYMAGALAVGGRDAAMFHLLTHAAYKSLLFLAAGAVIHVLGTNLMSEMGGLRHTMPVTFLTMSVGLGALAGVPPLAGFFSKESVLSAAEETALHGGPSAQWVGWLVFVAGLVTVAITAAYVGRLWLRTFFDPVRNETVGHDPAPAMRWPLIVLAVPAAALGVAGLVPGGVGDWVKVEGLVSEDLSPTVVGVFLSMVLLVIGFAWAYSTWQRDPAADPADALGRVRPAFERAFYVDDVYDALIVRPVRALARLVGWLDKDVVDAYVRGSGTGARLLGGALRYTQKGNVQTYLTGLLAGVVLLAVGAVVVLG
jgi:NADH-quinone oxidoreductase subunit L